MFESRRHVGLLRHGIVAFLGFGWRDVADGLQQPAMVEPVDTFERGIPPAEAEDRYYAMLERPAMAA